MVDAREAAHQLRHFLYARAFGDFGRPARRQRRRALREQETSKLRLCRVRGERPLPNRGDHFAHASCAGRSGIRQQAGRAAA